VVYELTNERGYPLSFIGVGELLLLKGEKSASCQAIAQVL
jgi:hypothetical protein